MRLTALFTFFCITSWISWAQQPVEDMGAVEEVVLDGTEASASSSESESSEEVDSVTEIPEENVEVESVEEVKEVEVEPRMENIAVHSEEAEKALDEVRSIKKRQKRERKLDSWDLPVELDKSIKIRKVYSFLNDPKKTKTGNDESLAYEFKYFNHGAITKAQKKSKMGQYFIVTWSAKEPADYVLRLDYRQDETREKVYQIQIPYKAAKGSYKGTFSVTGDAYALRGDVYSWRISVVRDNKIVAQEKSFIW